jgi:putative flippase GtrA
VPAEGLMRVPWTKLRYVAVGALCALLHNAIMIGADFLGLHYATSLVISYVIVVVVGYVLHVSYTFRAPASASGFVRYAIPMAANFPLTLAAMFVLCDVMTLPVPVAAPLTTVIMFAVNYVFSKWAIVGGSERGSGR